ncbi:HMG-Y-related protein A [Canna indica]|uniref:HMG-Y-related protein A n=1 Tax=Canna indica TaxID=4628 RepID=A0AAQ3KS05_9LILI|nr:HMG-Y-related protein A [Canna indica]
MASEEVSKPPSHPPYPEMIMAAIAELGEKDGSSRSAIAKYIAATYQDLPESHASLLTAHLASMKESGELLFIKNNYLRPGPDVPPKRGRGRPPKPKSEGDSAASEPPKSPRPRGRPPKPKFEGDAAASEPSESPRSRGRPPKPKFEGNAAASEPMESPRSRGRPPKPKDPLLAAVAKAASGMPKKRGRPQKKAVRTASADAGSAAAPAAVTGVKRGRGRPPKVKPVVEATEQSV